MLQETLSTSNREGESLTLELYVRSLAPPGIQSQQEAVIGRLERLEADGIIDEFSVEVCGRQLPATSTDGGAVGQRLRNRIDRFRRWATAADVSLESSFWLETVDSTMTDETYTRIRVPVMTLAEYEGDDLRFVTPCTDDGTAVTVTDHLDRIEGGVAAVPTSGPADVGAEQYHRGGAADE